MSNYHAQTVFLHYFLCMRTYRAGGDVVPVNGTELLENQGFDVDWLWYNQIGLVGLCVLFLTLGYVTLRLIKKER